MRTVLAGLRAGASNSRGAFATWSSTKSGSRNTVSPSTFWPAWRNSSTASGLANCTPISETMRRHPLSRTVTASGDRISYRGIVLRNIATSFQLGPALVLGPSCLGPVPEQASLDRPNTPNVRSHSRTEFHSMELPWSRLPWSRLPWSRGARGDQSHRNAGGRPGGTAAHRGRALPRLGDLHGAGGRHRAGQEHHVAAGARAGAWRAGPPGRRGPVPARRGVRPVRVARRRRSGPGRRRPALSRPARRGHRRDREPRRGARRPGRADRPGRQHVPDRRDQLAQPSGPAALRGARQGAARLQRRRATAGPPGALHREDHHQPGRAGRQPGRGARARLRHHRRGTRARAGCRGRAGPPRWRHRGGRAVGVRPGHEAHPGPDGRRRGGVRGPGGRRVRRARPPATSARDTDGTDTSQPAERRCRVTPDELLRQLYDFTLAGNAPAVLELTNAGLGMGLGPETLLYDALIPSLEEVGARFERGDFFVPEMLIAGKAMAGALEVLRPLLAETGAESIGIIVMGTVKGDVHDIGKNLVNIMFEGAGFQVIDLGVQVAPEKFVDAIREHKPDVVGFSAFLTTTMPMFKANINALEKNGLRDQVIVMVGGAPVTQEYANVVGADGYAADASAAVVRAKELIKRRRAAVASA